jgi:exodeoxyribonuclease VII large subunit
MSTQAKDVLSVSQLNRKAKMLLETHIPLLWIEGEISNFAKPSSGHWYFTLKDSKAQVRCAMFRNRNMGVRFNPEQGQQVLLRAKVSLYEGRGDYQLIAEHMEEAGHGALQRAFEALKFQLQQEGLFAQERKQALPTLPEHIGVITSPTGAAIHDILTVLERRFPSIPVTVLPVAVQGQDAAPQIAQAIDRANRAQLFDVLIVGRGGGSLEDLWPFNEEIVARAIANSQLPIVSAVGHEVDFTIADFVADARAATPSAAAEMLSPDGEDWLQTFAGYEILLEEGIKRKLAQQQQKVEWLRSRLRHPGERLQSQSQTLDNLDLRLQAAIKARLERQAQSLLNLSNRHQAKHPRERLQREQLKLQNLQEKLRALLNKKINGEQQRFAKAAGLLNAVSPLNTLKRGYAIVSNEEGVVLSSVQAVKAGDNIQAKLSDGELSCTVNTLK